MPQILFKKGVKLLKLGLRDPTLVPSRLGLLGCNRAQKSPLYLMGCVVGLDRNLFLTHRHVFSKGSYFDLLVTGNFPSPRGPALRLYLLQGMS